MSTKISRVRERLVVRRGDGGGGSKGGGDGGNEGSGGGVNGGRGGGGSEGGTAGGKGPRLGTCGGSNNNPACGGVVVILALARSSNSYHNRSHPSIRKIAKNKEKMWDLIFFYVFHIVVDFIFG
ncbi:hypothetical protein AAG906_009044 [Vitis piasezkii]